jgi:hypothetical protein
MICVRMAGYVKVMEKMAGSGNVTVWMVGLDDIVNVSSGVGAGKCENIISIFNICFASD